MARKLHKKRNQPAKFGLDDGSGFATGRVSGRTPGRPKGVSKLTFKSARLAEGPYVKLASGNEETCQYGHHWQRSDDVRTCPHCYRALVQGIEPAAYVVPEPVSRPATRVAPPTPGEPPRVEPYLVRDERMERIARNRQRAEEDEPVRLRPAILTSAPNTPSATSVTAPPPLAATRRKRSDLALGDIRVVLVEPQSRMKRAAVAAHQRSGKEVRLVCKQKDINVGAIEQEILRLWTAANGRCARTGVVFDETSHWLHASLDRLDSGRGYVPGNLQIVTWFYNRTKGALSDAGLAKLVSLHFGEAAHGR